MIILIVKVYDRFLRFVDQSRNAAAAAAAAAAGVVVVVVVVVVDDDDDDDDNGTPLVCPCSTVRRRSR